MPGPRSDMSAVRRMARSRTPGAYILLFRLTELVSLKVGRLGTFRFPPGHYAYVGSARGGLEARVGRQLRGDGKVHWHIDHLLPHAVARRALLSPSSEDIECALASAVAKMTGAAIPAPGFGSSDCRCPSHLFLLDHRATAELLRAARTSKAIVLRKPRCRRTAP